MELLMNDQSLDHNPQKYQKNIKQLQKRQVRVLSGLKKTKRKLKSMIFFSQSFLWK
jgi:hypothetical protein